MLNIDRYDERFRGYGMNKIVHLYHMNALEFDFCVLPRVFIIAAPHEPSKAYQKTFGKKAVCSSLFSV
jgi:glycosyltransferase-like protein LARGE